MRLTFEIRGAGCDRVQSARRQNFTHQDLAHRGRKPSAVCLSYDTTSHTPLLFGAPTAVNCGQVSSGILRSGQETEGAATPAHRTH
jgi:hypothetical protein